jgi:hypothetical protein
MVWAFARRYCATVSATTRLPSPGARQPEVQLLPLGGRFAEWTGQVDADHTCLILQDIPTDASNCEGNPCAGDRRTFDREQEHTNWLPIDCALTWRAWLQHLVRAALATVRKGDSPEPRLHMCFLRMLRSDNSRSCGRTKTPRRPALCFETAGCRSCQASLRRPNGRTFLRRRCRCRERLRR